MLPPKCGSTWELVRKMQIIGTQPTPPESDTLGVGGDFLSSDSQVCLDLIRITELGYGQLKFLRNSFLRHKERYWEYWDMFRILCVTVKVKICLVEKYA